MYKAPSDKSFRGDFLIFRFFFRQATISKTSVLYVKNNNTITNKIKK